MANKTNARLTKKEQADLTLTEAAIVYYRTHPVEAARDLLKVKLAWYQRLMLRGIWTHQFCLLLAGRRAGKSSTMCVYAVLKNMLFSNTKMGVFYPSKRQVDLFFQREVEKLYDQSAFMRASVKGKISTTMQYDRVKFKNGSFIEGFPIGTSGDKIRGAGYDEVLIDEYAFVSEDIINLVIRPFLIIKTKAKGNKLIVASSAFYKWNHLWKFYCYYKVQAAIRPDKYYVCNYNYLDLLADPQRPVDVDLEYIEEARSTMPQTLFKMEWESVFPSDSDGFFTPDLVDSVTIRQPPLMPRLDSSGEITFMGVDCARQEGGSNFAIGIVTYKDGIKKLIRVISKNGLGFQEMLNIVRDCWVKYKVTNIYIDSGGGGLTIKDLLAEEWTDPSTAIKHIPILDMEDDANKYLQGYKILKMVNFHGPMHSSLVINLKSEMEHKRFFVPVDVRRHDNHAMQDACLEIIGTKMELYAVQAVPRGNWLHFEAPSGFKTDRLFAVALANYAAMDFHANAFNKNTFITASTGRWV